MLYLVFVLHFEHFLVIVQYKLNFIIIINTITILIIIISGRDMSYEQNTADPDRM